MASKRYKIRFLWQEPLFCRVISKGRRPILLPSGQMFARAAPSRSDAFSQPGIPSQIVPNCQISSKLSKFTFQVEILLGKHFPVSVPRPDSSGFVSQ